MTIELNLFPNYIIIQSHPHDSSNDMEIYSIIKIFSVQAPCAQLENSNLHVALLRMLTTMVLILKFYVKVM